MATGKGTSKFGIEVDEALGLVAGRLAYPGVTIAGIHIHIGSMVAEPEPYADAMRVALDIIARCRKQGATITTLDLGGGFAVAYQPDQPEAPLEAIARAIVPPAQDAGVALLFEPGRAIVADAGLLITRVLYTKSNGGARYAIVDAAMNDLIRPALYGARHAVERLGPERAGNSTATYTYAIVGPICESGDTLAEGVVLPELQRGDVLAIHHAGAYGMSMASNYNTRARAAEVLIEPERWRVVRPRGTVEELMHGEIAALS
jgi:diaminopimelate decarboxylase